MSAAILDLPSYLCNSNQDASTLQRRKTEKNKETLQSEICILTGEELACFRCKTEVICRGLGALANKLC